MRRAWIAGCGMLLAMGCGGAAPQSETANSANTAKLADGRTATADAKAAEEQAAIAEMTKQIEKVSGAWIVTKAIREGKPADDIVGHVLTLGVAEFSIKGADGKVLNSGAAILGSFDSGPGQRTNTISFHIAEGKDKGKIWLGIYALDGDTLTICDNGPDPARDAPMKLEAPPGSGYILVTFARKK